METRAERTTQNGVTGWLINGKKMWTTGMHVATHCALFARTAGKDGDARGITCFLVPADREGVEVEEYLWTFNMPTDHPRVGFTDVFVAEDALFGELGKGLSVAQCFVHQNRIRQAASSLGAAVYCLNESVAYARRRKPFGRALAENQAIQWPLVELATQAEMLRLLIRKTAWEMDQATQEEIEHKLSDKVSMCNYWANRLCCEAADRAMQVHGGIGYSGAERKNQTRRTDERAMVGRPAPPADGAETLRQRWAASVDSKRSIARAAKPCNSVPAVMAASARKGESPALAETSQKYSSLTWETVMAPAPTASVASALPFSSLIPSGANNGCTIPAVAMAATRDEPCSDFITTAIKNGTSRPAGQASRCSPRSSAMPVSWQSRCRPPAAPTIMTMPANLPRT
jgi:hypothetical protein